MWTEWIYALLFQNFFLFTLFRSGISYIFPHFIPWFLLLSIYMVLFNLDIVLNLMNLILHASCWLQNLLSIRRKRYSNARLLLLSEWVIWSPPDKSTLNFASLFWNSFLLDLDVDRVTRFWPGCLVVCYVWDLWILF
jgi:hypothetical protein